VTLREAVGAIEAEARLTQSALSSIGNGPAAPTVRVVFDTPVSPTALPAPSTDSASARARQAERDVNADDALGYVVIEGDELDAD
jgi:hypothetical protein